MKNQLNQESEVKVNRNNFYEGILLLTKKLFMM